MLNLALEEVKKYEKNFSAVPVCAEVFADMMTPISFLNSVRESSNNYFLLESVRAVKNGDAIPSSALIQ